MTSITEDTLNVIYLYIPSCALGFGLVFNLLTLAALLRAIGCLANGSTGTGSSDRSEAAAATSSANSSVGTRLVPRTHFLVVVLLANYVLVLLTRPTLDCAHLDDLLGLRQISSCALPSVRLGCVARWTLHAAVCGVLQWMLPVLIVESHVLRSENAFLQTIYPASSGGGRTRALTVSFCDDLRRLVAQASEVRMLANLREDRRVHSRLADLRATCAHFVDLSDGLFAIRVQHTLCTPQFLSYVLDILHICCIF